MSKTEFNEQRKTVRRTYDYPKQVFVLKNHVNWSHCSITASYQYHPMEGLSTQQKQQQAVWSILTTAVTCTATPTKKPFWPFRSRTLGLRWNNIGSRAPVLQSHLTHLCFHQKSQPSNTCINPSWSNIKEVSPRQFQDSATSQNTVNAGGKTWQTGRRRIGERRILSSDQVKKIVLYQLQYMKSQCLMKILKIFFLPRLGCHHWGARPPLRRR